MSYLIKKSNPILFIHIPKTAGKSIIESFKNVSCEIIPNNRTHNNNFHSTLLDCKNLPDYNKIWKFTVVRNPWRRAVSWYNFRKKTLLLSLKRMKNNNKSVVKVVNNFEKINKEYELMNEDFNLWLESYIDCPWDFTWFSLSDDQTSWIEPFTDINKIFKYETLNKDFKKQFDLTLPYYNVSTNQEYNWRSLYNKKSIDLIKDYYKRDIENFDYYFK